LHAVQIQPLLLPTLRIWNLDEENEKSFILREEKKKGGTISKQKCLNSVSANGIFLVNYIYQQQSSIGEWYSSQ
jgi:hypothetical protein